MKNIIINEKNNMLVIKLIKNFYKGNKLVILPITNGFLEIKKDEEDYSYRLYFTSNNNEDKMVLFTFGTFKEAEEIKEDIERYFIKKGKITINTILKNILLITLIVAIPFALINLNEIIKTQKMEIFSKILSSNVSANNIKQEVKPNTTEQIFKILENKLKNKEKEKEKEKNPIITTTKNNTDEVIKEDNKQTQDVNSAENITSEKLNEDTISDAQKEMNEQLKIIKEKREKNVDLEK